jgi:hypothetical protein
MLQSYEVRNKITRLLLLTIGREHDEENHTMSAGAVASLVKGAIQYQKYQAIKILKHNSIKTNEDQPAIISDFVYLIAKTYSPKIGN